MEQEERLPPQIEATSQLLNPFVHKLDLNSRYDKFKLVFLSILVVPFRILGIMVCLLVAYILATAGLWGLSREQMDAAPLSGWRGTVKRAVRCMVRLTFSCFGLPWVSVKGIPSNSKEAPLLVVAPHSAYFDALPVVCMGAPSVVAKAEIKDNPIFSKFIDYTQPVYVSREDPNSRQSTILEIKRRAVSDQDWPQIMVFPEGTCTNRTCLITFKPGAFYPGVPVQPVVIRYPNNTDCITWTWDSPGVLKMLWVTLCQFHNYCEIEYLPVYTPNQEEQADAKLFASNVRAVMAKSLGIPVADYTYDDCQLMSKARLKNLPCQTGLIEFHKLRQRLGLNLKNVEDELMNQFADIAISDGLITVNDFSKYLGIPQSEPALVELFNLYDKDGSGKIDFRHYLVGYCQYVKPANTEETLSWAFKLFDRGTKGHITCEDTFKALSISLDMTIEQSTRIFKQADLENKGFITYEDFVAHARKKPEYAQIFLTYQQSIKDGSRYPHTSLTGKEKAE